jgi:hypothetical protein
MYQTVDPQRRCPKCGGSASLEHRHDFGMFEMAESFEFPGGLIVRRCERCAHSWYELPLDHVPLMDEELRVRRESWRASLASATPRQREGA